MTYLIQRQVSMKIILREYRLALKKNKRKDAFRDKITKNVEEQVKDK